MKYKILQKYFRKFRSTINRRELILHRFGKCSIEYKNYKLGVAIFSSFCIPVVWSETADT